MRNVAKRCNSYCVPITPLWNPANGNDYYEASQIESPSADRTGGNAGGEGRFCEVQKEVCLYSKTNSFREEETDKTRL